MADKEDASSHRRDDLQVGPGPLATLDRAGVAPHRDDARDHVPTRDRRRRRDPGHPLAGRARGGAEVVARVDGIRLPRGGPDLDRSALRRPPRHPVLGATNTDLDAFARRRARADAAGQRLLGICRGARRSTSRAAGRCTSTSTVRGRPTSPTADAARDRRVDPLLTPSPRRGRCGQLLPPPGGRRRRHGLRVESRTPRRHGRRPSRIARARSCSACRWHAETLIE